MADELSSGPPEPAAAPSILETIGHDAFLAVAAMLAPRELGAALGVCASWRAPLDASEHVWGLACRVAWRGKAYVPRKLRELAGGAAAVEAAAVAERDALLALKVGALKERLRALPRATLKECVEKRDFVEALLAHERRRAEAGAPTARLLACPRLLARARENLAKAALRLSLADARRTRITADELTAHTFNVRLRGDGPLAQAAAYDPWWAGKGRGEARFSTQAEGGWVRLSWPKGEDGQPMDPFVPLGMPQAPDSLEWRLEHEGAAVRLIIMGRDGPIEVVSRHPETWGWVLFSQGTVWTSWTMPSQEDNDPVLAEENLANLPSDLQLAPSW